MKLYNELAHWWPLFSPPAHYVEEAADLLTILEQHGASSGTLLELGSGGGSLVNNFGDRFQLTLTDVSPAMIAVNRAVNPPAEFFVGDMRDLRLQREFDIVFVHDAVMYMTTPDDLQRAIETAAIHCKPGGLALFIPDHVKETYEPDLHSGGEDGEDGSGMRYLQWSWDPDPQDNTALTVFTMLFREADGSISNELDVQTFGLFTLQNWLDWLRDAGFDPQPSLDKWNRYVFAARKVPLNAVDSQPA